MRTRPLVHRIALFVIAGGLIQYALAVSLTAARRRPPGPPSSVMYTAHTDSITWRQAALGANESWSHQTHGGIAGKTLAPPIAVAIDDAPPEAVTRWTRIKDLTSGDLGTLWSRSRLDAVAIAHEIWKWLNAPAGNGPGPPTTYIRGTVADATYAPSLGPIAEEITTTLSFGLPLPSIRCSFYTLHTPEFQTHVVPRRIGDSWTATDPARARIARILDPRDAAVLPLGTIINTACVAVVLFAVTQAPSAARRWSRRRRRRCVTCGHQLIEGDRCQECGASIGPQRSDRR